MCEPEIVERPVAGGGVKAHEQNHAAEKREAVAAENQIQNGAHQIGPADEAKDAIPFGVN